MKPAPWTYLFVYADDLGSEERIERFVNKSPHILNWQKSLPNSYFLVSHLAAKSLAEHIKDKFGQKRFIVVDTQLDRNGWLPRSAWSLMSNPKASIDRITCEVCGFRNHSDAKYCNNCGNKLATE